MPIKSSGNEKLTERNVLHIHYILLNEHCVDVIENGWENGAGVVK